MPKKNHSRSKSTRKPLREVTNGLKHSSKRVAPDTAACSPDDVASDRLVLAHSNLSALIRQIDELADKAFKVKSKREVKTIESLTHCFTEMETTLKPWVTKIQNILSRLSTESENELHDSLTRKTPDVHEDTSNAIDSPTSNKLDSLVSPSPLVSWPANCTAETGRQLFLLTPIPSSKVFSSKLLGFSKSIFEKMASNSAGERRSPLASGDKGVHIFEDAVNKLTPQRVSYSAIAKMNSTVKRGFVSPSKITKRDCSMVIMTPCLKMSPPKSCVLLEPISEVACHKEKPAVRKSTPFPLRVQESSDAQDSESSSDGASQNLVLKYPELVGIKPAQKLINRKKLIEESPNWFMSPPKTCILMEPFDKESFPNSSAVQLPTTSIQDQSKDSPVQLPMTSNQNQPKDFPLIKEEDTQIDHFSGKINFDKETACCLPMVDSSPLWTETESIAKGGKYAGESTLKRELWTRFEAVSTHTIRLNGSVLQGTSRKGFLDLLNEASL